MISNIDLVTLQFKYAKKSFEENFRTLDFLVQKSPKNSIVLAPELCLSGYNYDDMQKNVDFSKKIIPSIKKLSKDRILSLTLIEGKEGKFFNNAKIYHNQQEIYSRAKARLFSLGDEDKYFTSGNDEDIKIIEIEGIKIALLICFELRYIELWGEVKGADIILIPSYWGKPRKSHLMALSTGLAIANQCFVVVANSSDEDMASSSCIINPFGEVYEDDSKEIISKKFDKNLIKKIRRYINIGLV